MAPVPSETCSVCETPMDGSVTVPTSVNWWVSGQIRTWSPRCSPSCRMVIAPNSTWYSPARGWPLVVGGSTAAPRCWSRPRTGTSGPAVPCGTGAPAPAFDILQLAEPELRPAGHARLAADEADHRRRPPGTIATLRLDQYCPVPAVLLRVRDQATEARAEQQGRCHRRDGGGRSGQRSPDRRTQPARR